jgi:hypothetical protein
MNNEKLTEIIENATEIYCYNLSKTSTAKMIDNVEQKSYFLQDNNEITLWKCGTRYIVQEFYAGDDTHYLLPLITAEQQEIVEKELVQEWLEMGEFSGEACETNYIINQLNWGLTTKEEIEDIADEYRVIELKTAPNETENEYWDYIRDNNNNPVVYPNLQQAINEKKSYDNPLTNPKLIFEKL